MPDEEIEETEQHCELAHDGDENPADEIRLDRLQTQRVFSDLRAATCYGREDRRGTRNICANAHKLLLRYVARP